MPCDSLAFKTQRVAQHTVLLATRKLCKFEQRVVWLKDMLHWGWDSTMEEMSR